MMWVTLADAKPQYNVIPVQKSWDVLHSSVINYAVQILTIFMISCILKLWMVRYSCGSGFIACHDLWNIYHKILQVFWIIDANGLVHELIVPRGTWFGLDVQISMTLVITLSCIRTFLVPLLLGICPNALLMISWYHTVMQQAISWTNCDPDICLHMALLSHSRSVKTMLCCVTE